MQHAGGEGQARRASAPRSQPATQTTPAYLGKLVKDETEKWAAPIKASGVSVE